MNDIVRTRDVVAYNYANKRRVALMSIASSGRVKETLPNDETFTQKWKRLSTTHYLTYEPCNRFADSQLGVSITRKLEGAAILALFGGLLWWVHVTDQAHSEKLPVIEPLASSENVFTFYPENQSEVDRGIAKAIRLCEIKDTIPPTPQPRQTIYVNCEPGTVKQGDRR